VLISEWDVVAICAIFLNLRLRTRDVPRGACWWRFLLLLSDALAVADVGHFDAVLTVLSCAVLLHGEIVAVFVGLVVFIDDEVNVSAFCAFEKASLVQFEDVDFEFDHGLDGLRISSTTGWPLESVET